MSPRIFVTGFGPFSETANNPSAVLAAEWPEHRVLDVSWQAVDEWLDCDEANEFDILLHLGFADRPHMTPELFARNTCGEKEDAQGAVKEGEVEPGGPMLVASTLWTPTVVGDMLLDDRLRISEDAGTYLCNYISYRSLRRHPKKRVGFMHVPSFEKLPQQSQVEVLVALLARLGAPEDAAS